MEITLHLGAHRTGTKTLQSYLSRNRGALGRQGIAVWGPERTRAGLYSGLVRRPDAIDLATERRGHRSVSVIRVESQRLETLGTRHLIVSEENMLGSILCNLQARSLYPLAGERLLRFAEAYADRCTRLAVSVRSYETYWSSCLAYGLGRGFEVPNRAMLDHLVTQPRRWRQVLAEVGGIFPNAEVVVLPFERLAPAPDRVLGEISPGPVMRPRVGARGWLNRGASADTLAQVLRDRGERGGAFAPKTGDTGRWQPFEADQIAALRAEYEADLEWIAGAGASGIRLAGDQLAATRASA